jgi:hypothetical protein
MARDEQRILCMCLRCKGGVKGIECSIECRQEGSKVTLLIVIR